MALFPEVELVILVKGPVRGYLGWPVSPLRAIPRNRFSNHGRTI